MSASSMSLDMARLSISTVWTSDIRLCRTRSDKVALPSASGSTALVVAAAFASAGRCFFEASSCPAARHVSLLWAPSRRRPRRSVVLAFNSDFYYIPYTEGIPVGSKLKLFNLPYNCDRDALIQHFGTCGAAVESLEITNNPEEEGNASGYVVLGDLDQACAAVAQLDGARFQGKCVRMDFVERRPHDNSYNSKSHLRTRSVSSAPAPVANRVYIGNLPWRVDDTTLQQLFSAHGTVQEAQVMRDRINGRSRGFGFVVMSTASEMEKAIAALDGCEVQGRSLKVNVAMSPDN